MTPSGSFVKSFKNLGTTFCNLDYLISLVLIQLLSLCDVHRPIKLVVAKCWDPNPKGYFTIPRTEPVRPIDPGAWVAHTEAARGGKLPRIYFIFSLLYQILFFFVLGGSQSYPNRPPSVATMTSTTTSIMSSLPETERKSQHFFFLFLFLFNPFFHT